MRSEKRRVGHRRRWVGLCAGALVAFLAMGAGAVPHVYVAPAEVAGAPGESFELSVRAAATGDSIAGFQLYLSFDPAVIELVEATEGTLYLLSGSPTWPSFDEVEPGFWHFFDTLLGVGTYIEPPGELLHLTFDALADGETTTHADTIRLSDSRRNAYPVVLFDPSVITISATGIGEGTFLRLGPASPNPFETSTSIAYSVPLGTSGWGADIYDVSGRRVRRLAVPSGSTDGDLQWDGRSDDGREVSAGIYFLRFDGAAGEVSTRLVKVR